MTTVSARIQQAGLRNVPSSRGFVGKGPAGLLAAAGFTAFIIVLVFALMVVRPWSPDAPLLNDFISFWTGASLVRDGAGPDLYDMEKQAGFQQKLRGELGLTEEVRRRAAFDPYHNPPPLALLFVPLTLLPIYWAYLLWSALSLLATLVAIALPLRGYSHARVTALAILAFSGVADTLLWGQVNGLFLLVLSLSLMALGSGRPLLAGALLGVLWLKPQYAALFPLVFLMKGRWRELAGMVGTGIAVAGLSLVMVGPGGIVRYLEVLSRIGGFYPPSSSLIRPENMVNWRALLMNLWPGIPEVTGSILVAALGVATVLASLLAWCGSWAPSSPWFPRQLLVTILATLVALPHSHFHGTILLLAPLSMALARPMPGALQSRAWGPMLALGYLLALLIWPVRSLAWLFVPYSLLVMAVLTVQLRGGAGKGAEL